MTLAFAGNPVVKAILLCTLGIWAGIEIRQALNRRIEATNKDRGSRDSAVRGGSALGHREGDSMRAEDQ